MIDVCLLGTGGMMPLPYRFLTSLMLKSNGKTILIDCGEATQVAIKKAKLSTYDIDYILITHFHADHISGIIGLLLSMGNSDRKEDVTIIGPSGLTKVMHSLRIIAPEIPFNINIVEYNDDHNFIDLNPFKVEYFKLKHKIICYGYNIYLDRLPEFLPDKAKENNVPLKFWNKLQHGIICEDAGITYTPNMVMGEDRQGLKVSYFTDTRPCDNIMNYCSNADLMIAEGMYGLDDKLLNAKKHMHMTMHEICEIAKELNPKELWLTHYSPAENKPQIYEGQLKSIFNNVIISKDGERKVLLFE